jgi:hypothetical protein
MNRVDLERSEIGGVRTALAVVATGGWRGAGKGGEVACSKREVQIRHTGTSSESVDWNEASFFPLLLALVVDGWEGRGMTSGVYACRRKGGPRGHRGTFCFKERERESVAHAPTALEDAEGVCAHANMLAWAHRRPCTITHPESSSRGGVGNGKPAAAGVMMF